MTSSAEIIKFKQQNVLLSWNEYLQGKTILSSMPSRSFIELTKNCNFSCIMCKHSFDPAFKEYRPEYNMPVPLFEKVAETLFPYMVFVDFRGYGETTVLPYWPEVVEYLSRFPAVQWHLNTNLSLPRPEIWQKMIANNFRIAFSCDGATKTTFERIRKGANFEKTLVNLAAVTEAIRRYKKGALYFLVTIQASNILEVPDLIRMAHDYHVGCIALRVVRWDDGSSRSPEEIFCLPRESIKEILRESVSLAADFRIHVDINDVELAGYVDHWPGPQDFPDPYWFANEAFEYEPFKYQSYAVAKNQKCFKPFGYVFVYHDGLVGPCNHLSYPPVMLGNLNEHSFEEIWNGKPFQDFRKQLLSARPEHPDCRWCFRNRNTD